MLIIVNFRKFSLAHVASLIHGYHFWNPACNGKYVCFFFPLCSDEEGDQHLTNRRKPFKFPFQGKAELYDCNPPYPPIPPGMMIGLLSHPIRCECIATVYPAMAAVRLIAMCIMYVTFLFLSQNQLW